MHATCTTFLWQAVKAKETNGDCFDPERGNYYSPKFRFCVYAINYELNDGVFTFDDKLYFNNAQLYNDSDITIDEFEIAAKPLCDAITDINATYYYGAWVKTKMDTYKDMFMGCCIFCQALSRIDWLITLKIQIINLSKFALLRKDMLIYRKKMLHSFYDTIYISGGFARIPACESSNYNLIPVLLRNRVGFASAFERSTWESLLLRAIAPPRQKNPAYIGQYTSAIANKYKRNHCLNSYTFIPYSVCHIYVLLSKHYGYECCCYGSKIPLCQERIRNTIITGASAGLQRAKKACVIDKDSVNYQSEINFNTDGIEYKGDVFDLMNDMEQNNLNSMNDYEIKEMSYYTDLINVSLNATNLFECMDFSSWDSREHDILQFICAQLLPLDAQCPFSSSKIFKQHQHIMCCCGHRSFCNYNPDIIKRASTKSIPNLCEYNNEYQYFLHDYFYPTQPDVNHTCLLHFVSGNALNDMNNFFPQEDSIVYFLPGSAIQPIDFSYALLEPNKCDYLDVNLKDDYLRTRYCYGSTKFLKYFETEFMPMRLFACRCQTAPGDNVPCDSMLKHNIAKKAKNSDRKYYCATYNRQHSVKFNQRPKFEVNDLSSYCVTILDFKVIGDKIYYTFNGHIARRTLINKVKFRLAMIPYTMYTLSGDATQLCMHLVKGEMILCICRNDYTNREPCNLNPYEKGRALQLALHETSLSKSRKLFPNGLAAYTTSKKPKFCHSESIFSTIITNGRDLLCAEKMLQEECGIMSESDLMSGINNEMIVCCCGDNCDSVGSQLHELTYNYQ
ncbi:unnamed protein product [Cercopithifilaria johnstoni]|uniref:Uncharacterized protein n=1 Tax=Cercopithifilaria johnstoni TaxID=2874296 RepID=A0A8J2LXP1_9BILA|nr:unnamed protein product [Cercopithifilaria johnstoni]